MSRGLDPNALLDAIFPQMRLALPPELPTAYFDAFVRRSRPRLLALLERLLQVGPVDDLPELWTARKRADANLQAMNLLAQLANVVQPGQTRAGLPIGWQDHFSQIHLRTPAEPERRILMQYSGWGGLSIEAAASRFAPGIPHPEERGLIHEYFTPTRVTREVARVIGPLLPGLLDSSGVIQALEPSAGIGRFLNSFAGNADIRWHVVEWSALSALLLKALYPEMDLYLGPFERWVRDQGARWAGRLQLVVSNPPYGPRGASVTDDPDRSYREKKAYLYFLRRGLDLLAPNGLGVFLVPAGFMTGTNNVLRDARERVLRRHHLAAAYRLPSQRPGGREAIFPGATLVTDLLFFRARGGELAEVDEADRPLLDGQYFQLFPTHILGRELGTERGDDDQTGTPRYHYQVEGEFSRLPDLVERPICAACATVPFKAPPAPPELSAPQMSEDEAAMVALGKRVGAYLNLLAGSAFEEAGMLWQELHAALIAWNSAGNPHVRLHPLVQRGVEEAGRLASAFDRLGNLIPGLAEAPPAPEARWTGATDDVLGQAEALFRSQRSLSLEPLLAFHREAGGSLAEADVVARLFGADWAMAPGETLQLVPPEDYYTGELWPKHDQVQHWLGRPPVLGSVEPDVLLAQLERQLQRLLLTIKPAIYDDIEGVTPRQGWIPLDMVQQWINETFSSRRYEDVRLHRAGGLVQVEGVAYGDLEERGIHPEILLIVGWINHDRTLFSPSKRGQEEKDLDKLRLLKAAEWEAGFKGWLAADAGRRARIEHAYNRNFRGWVHPTYTAAALPIARWNRKGPALRPHQIAAARRVLANRGGLVALDVGVGKTYTALSILARARQDGLAKRPVILVPNSIIWKWVQDILRVLPDYRVVVIGSKRKVIQRGERKGYVTSDTDTPQERAEKWSRFQAGEFDVVLLSYTALARTRMSEEAVVAYANSRSAIQREVELSRRNAGARGKLTERQAAILKEGTAAWVAQKLELPEDWEYDPGIRWDDLGVDLLVVDEAQNFKNKHQPEPREGGVPRYMGNPGDGSNRAWQLDFRCASVRRNAGGGGVVLLSATPAKNSPLEFYNLLEYVDGDVWTRLGILDAEGFVDRYCRIELKPTVNTRMEVEERGCCVGFTNLHELRDVIFRLGEFKTAEEVGLILPEPRVELVEVDMNDAQNTKYNRYVRQIEEALADPTGGVSILGALARMALVAIHPSLDEGFSWKTAESVEDPHSPKFDALAERVLLNRSCGHIVFVDNLAAHRWVRDVLVEAGIAADRIAILNAEVAPAAADRQRIAQDFNGNPETGALPKYDVVIANAIAYEGIDLQTRTCAIHHLDLPWEPATLQQRNGRGVRQGNTLASISIYYYFSRRSQDGMRFSLIQGKRGWMTQLLKSQDRDTNNPGAQMDLGPEEILLLISRDPEKTRAQLDAVRSKRQKEAREKIHRESNKLLRATNTRFRAAERKEDPAEAARLRGEAEERLKQLQNVNPEAWPWAAIAEVVRERELRVEELGGPIWEGLRVALPNELDPDRPILLEIGKIVEKSVGKRGVFDARWVELDWSQTTFTTKLRPEHYAPVWPGEAEAKTDEDLKRLLYSIQSAGNLNSLNWHFASEAWLAPMWERNGRVLLQTMARADTWTANQQRVPFMDAQGMLRVGTARDALGGEVFAPTEGGWLAWLDAARYAPHNLKWQALDTIGKWWWRRNIPRDLLADGEESTQIDALPVAHPGGRVSLVAPARQAGSVRLDALPATCGGQIDLQSPERSGWEGRGFGRRYLFHYRCPRCGGATALRASAWRGREPVPAVGAIRCTALRAPGVDALPARGKPVSDAELVEACNAVSRLAGDRKGPILSLPPTAAEIQAWQRWNDRDGEWDFLDRADDADAMVVLRNSWDLGESWAETDPAASVREWIAQGRKSASRSGNPV